MTNSLNCFIPASSAVSLAVMLRSSSLDRDRAIGEGCRLPRERRRAEGTLAGTWAETGAGSGTGESPLDDGLFSRKPVERPREFEGDGPDPDAPGCGSSCLERTGFFPLPFCTAKRGFGFELRCSSRYSKTDLRVSFCRLALPVAAF